MRIGDILEYQGHRVPVIAVVPDGVVIRRADDGRQVQIPRLTARRLLVQQREAST